jgi:hypothetical protein
VKTRVKQFYIAISRKHLNHTKADYINHIKKIKNTHFKQKEKSNFFVFSRYDKKFEIKLSNVQVSELILKGIN